MERGVVILLGGFVIAGVIGAVALLSGAVKVDVALMPASSVGETIKTMGSTVDVSLQRGGAIKISNRATSVERLPSELDARFRALGAKADKREQTIVIWADPDVPKSDLDRVLERLKAGGWTRIQLSRVARKALGVHGGPSSPAAGTPTASRAISP
ncbi:hypothetical protein [Caulobacter sp.]|uniref:ExbD/TolR family protein n=1 Tax=Caulobacter sp. TaxID=78 RepID=UPI002B46F460|nr:hypothetical protein [Caulobacter sp.]HJV42946.1 hypothetical protein [Caulobacter sp.]